MASLMRSQKINMKTCHKGFTVIEMMIVLVIIGIVSAIGINQYISYTKRSHAAEGLLLSDGARLSFMDFYNSYSKMPANNQEAGLAAPDEYKGNAVVSVEIVKKTTQSVIRITFNEKVIDGDTIEYEMVAGTSTTEWDCTGGTLLNQYRPGNCR